MMVLNYIFYPSLGVHSLQEFSVLYKDMPMKKLAPPLLCCGVGSSAGKSDLRSLVLGPSIPEAGVAGNSFLELAVGSQYYYTETHNNIHSKNYK